MIEVTRILSLIEQGAPQPPNGCFLWSTSNFEFWPVNVCPTNSRANRCEPRPWFMMRIFGWWGKTTNKTGTIVAIFLRQLQIEELEQRFTKLESMVSRLGA